MPMLRFGKVWQLVCHSLMPMLRFGKVWQVIRHYGVLFFAINFVTSRQIETPYLSPYGYPNNVPVGQKTVEHKKNSATFLY